MDRGSFGQGMTKKVALKGGGSIKRRHLHAGVLKEDCVGVMILVGCAPVPTFLARALTSSGTTSATDYDGNLPHSRLTTAKEKA